jgi:S1-C subfamily serine protease
MARPLDETPTVWPLPRRRRPHLVLLRVFLALAVLVPGGVWLAAAHAQHPGSDPRSLAADPVQRVLSSVAEVRVRSGGSAGLVHASLGTAVVLTADGLLVTNDHVIALAGDGRPIVSITMADGRSAEAEVVLRVPERDLAFLRVRLSPLTPAVFVDDLDEVTPREPAFAVGAPEHFEDEVARGQVVSVLRHVNVPDRPELGVLIVSTAPVLEGFSGGPLADENGEVMGLTVAILTNADGSRETLAIPSTVVLRTARAVGVL